MNTRTTRIAAAATVVAIWLGLAATAGAQTPRWVRLSYGAGDAATGITVSWNADSAMTPATVEYGTTTSYGQTATGSASAAALPGPLGFGHEVELSGLESDTLYHYRAGVPGNWSPDATFMTAPPDGCSPLRFVAMGDGRSDGNAGANVKWDSILLEAFEQNPLFAVNTGDLVRDGGESDQWDDWMEKSTFVNPFLPHMPSIGNHDDDSVEGDGAMFNRLFALPANSTSNTEDYYAFTAGNAVFVAISTTTYNDDAFAAQAAWLDATLTAHADKLWKFIYFHHPIYTSHASFPIGSFEFNHPPNEQGQNAALVPVIDAHHVDIVFQGHNHYYERFDPLVGGGGADEGNLATGFDDGTVYIITGGAGAFTYDEFDLFGITIDLVGWLCGSNPSTGSNFCDGRHHYVVLEIVNNVLNVQAVSTTEQNFGTDTPEVFDIFSITKPVGDNCTGTDGGGGGGDDDLPGGDDDLPGGDDDLSGGDDVTTGGDDATATTGDTTTGTGGTGGTAGAGDVSSTTNQGDGESATDDDTTPPGAPGGCNCQSGGRIPVSALLFGLVFLMAGAFRIRRR